MSLIVSFSVSNFRSFLEEQTFSLVASKRLSGKHEDHLLPIPDSSEMVSRTAVLYGANGSGKSNLFKALRYLREFALLPRKPNSGTGRQAFCFADVAVEPSVFDLQFVSSGKLYRLGCRLDNERVLEEWLLQVIGSSERIIYERVTDPTGSVRIEAPGIGPSQKKLSALATVGGRANQSFLATVRATLESPEIGLELGGILNWLDNELILIAPDESLGSLGQVFTEDSELLKFAGTYLKVASTGVDHLTLAETEITEDDLRRELPEIAVTTILNAMKEGRGTGVVRLREGNELHIKRTDQDRFYRVRMDAMHEHAPGRQIPLALNEESDGTRRLVHLTPVLHHPRTDSATYFIDEIDRSLHPMLVKNFLESFLSKCPNAARQLIVTTHESNLLDQDLLRRDEIWFVEKDEKAATHLYSLMDFKVRNDLELRKHYLQGRFGAVPFLGELGGLFQEKGHAE